VTKFEAILPRLTATYEAGRLVPFLGSGMSMPVCTDWWTFVQRLECASGRETEPLKKSLSREELIRRANNAVRSLKARKQGSFEPAIRQALLSNPAKADIPTQTRALAKLWWPLVLSTNYDNCYCTAAREAFPNRQVVVVGRGVEDCQRVLNALSVPGRSLYWALQGYLDTPHPPTTDESTSSLHQQLVVGHEEYRRVTYRDVHFRRAFAEVFSQRSLFFLGAGIQEPYLQELFGEVLEYYGPSTRPHYAFIRKGEVDPEFMLARFQIIAVEYPRGEHHRVVERLEELAAKTSSPSCAPVSWSWGRIARRAENEWFNAPDLEVVRGPLPTMRVEGECLAVSAGGSGSSFFFSDGIQHLINKWGIDADRHPKQVSEYLGNYQSEHVFAVRARSRADERSLAHVYNASLDLFKRVAHRYRCIRMQLLATGGTDKQAAVDHWKVRNFPERFSFIQTVRAWGTWRAANPGVDCRLSLHVVLDAVYHDVASGRIDVLELLSCRDLRFFVEVIRDGADLERRLFQVMPDTPLDDIVRQLQLSPAHWTMQVTPPPSLDEPRSDTLCKLGKQTLQSLGVVPGSTIHFRRIKKANTRRHKAAAQRKSKL
jgi:SIR2-like protein